MDNSEFFGGWCTGLCSAAAIYQFHAGSFWLGMVAAVGGLLCVILTGIRSLKRHP